MKVLELYAGQRSIGKAFEKHGHEVVSIDWDETLQGIDYYMDINDLDPMMVRDMFNGADPDVIWASPDCATYSVIAIGHHRKKDIDSGILEPVSEYARICDASNYKLSKLLHWFDESSYIFVENPRGGMRKMGFYEWMSRYTVTYCQYGDTRMKPTDIWTNHPDPQFKPPCKNGMPCHTPSPRGSHAMGSTKALKNAKLRSVIQMNYASIS